MIEVEVDLCFIIRKVATRMMIIIIIYYYRLVDIFFFLFMIVISPGTPTADANLHGPIKMKE